MTGIGIELDAERQLPRSRILRPSLQDMKAPASERRPGVAPEYLPMVVRAVLPYLETECLRVLPPQQDLDSLIQIFKQEIHPILPIVDFTTTALAEPVNREDAASITLRQAICLAACKNTSAKQYLNLPKCENGPIAQRTPREFADATFSALKIALDIGLVDNRLELVQVLALMTLHSYGPDGDDEVSRLCGQAVHYAYSAGLHYPSRPESPLSETRRMEILCSLFALDKIIAMVTARPTIIRSNEICLPAENDDTLRTLPPGLQLLFCLCQRLDRILDLYRARPPHEMEKEECIWETSWQGFEDLARDCNAHTMEAPLQVTLELLCHSMSVISYRPPKALPIDHQAPEITPSPSIQSSKMRQKYCAQQVCLLLEQETTMLPFIPYAASLSLTVALRTIRTTILESRKRIAKKDAEKSLQLLDRLADIYWHAESTSMVGRRILQSLL